jgi:hypothetical protein
MVELNIDPATPLKTALMAKATLPTIYVNGELPSASLPAEYITIEKNGGIGSSATKRESGQCTLLLTLNIELKSGAVNTVKESLILGKFQTLFDKPLISGRFSYFLAPYPFVYEGKNITAAYSQKIININCFINY